MDKSNIYPDLDYFAQENSGQNNGRTSPFSPKYNGQGLVLKQGFPVLSIMRVCVYKIMELSVKKAKLCYIS